MIRGRYEARLQHHVRKSSKAGGPLRLPLKAPPCWTGRQAEWEQYRSDANFSASKGFTFCVDCTPERKAEMVKQGRCQYPRTVFVVSYGVLVGRRRGGKKTQD